MPFNSVSALKKSDLYAKMTELHGFSKAKLEKFVATFNAVVERVMRGGASLEHAEATGIAIAMSAARRAADKGLMAGLEDEKHYFVPAMPQQLGMDGTGSIAGVEHSFDYMKENLDMVKSIAAGLAFNWDHKHHNPLGVIVDVLLPSEAPAHVQAKLDKDTPFVFVASYSKDITEEARNEIGVSMEWDSFKAASGKTEVIPYTFAVSPTPLNGPEMGIKRVAAVPEETDEQRVIKASVASDEQGDKMSDELKAQVASLTTEVEAGKTALTAKDSELTSLKASLEAEGKKVADLIAEKAALSTQIASLQAEANKAEAAKYADGLAKAGKIQSDKVEFVASLYLKHGKADTEAIVASLSTGTLGAHAGQGAAAVPVIESSEDKLKKAVRAALKA